MLSPGCCVPCCNALEGLDGHGSMCLLQAGLPSWEALLKVWMELLVWSTFGVLDHVAWRGTVTALGTVTCWEVPRVWWLCRWPICSLSLSRCLSCSGLMELRDTVLAKCLVHSPGRSVGHSFTVLTFIWALSPLGEGGSHGLCWGKTGLWGRQGTAATPGPQGTVSASHNPPGPSLLPACGLCMHGGKGYSLLLILIKTTDNLLFSK